MIWTAGRRRWARWLGVVSTWLLIGGQKELIKAAVTTARSVPVVTTAVDSDPLAQGYIASLSHPGGNLTGVVFQQFELMTKRLDLLTQAVTGISRIVLLYDIAGVDQAEAAKRSAAALGIPLEPIKLRGIPYDYEQALAETDGARGDALIVTAACMSSWSISSKSTIPPRGTVRATISAQATVRRSSIRATRRERWRRRRSPT
jgi:hypothetical protein